MDESRGTFFCEERVIMNICGRCIVRVEEELERTNKLILWIRKNTELSDGDRSLLENALQRQKGNYILPSLEYLRGQTTALLFPCVEHRGK